MRDDYALVLDFLPTGHGNSIKPEPVAQIIGDQHFNLLEVIVRQDSELKPMQRVYIGRGERDEVRSIVKKLAVKDLTGTARSELESAIEKIVTDNEDYFVKFFNYASPVTTRQHQLELLPGIGKKHMWNVLEERKKKPFESFDDIGERVKLLPNPKKTIITKITEELEGDAKTYLFVRPPKKEF